MAELFKAIWGFLKDEANLKSLSLIGASFAVLCGAIWKVFTYFRSKPEPKKTDAPFTLAPVINNSASGGTATGGTASVVINQGISPEESDRKHQELLAAIARERGVDPKFLTPLFEAAGHDVNITPEQFEPAIRAAVEALIARSNNLVEPSNDGADIDAAIRAARQKLATLDTEAALDILRKREAEEAASVQARNRGRASLKREEAAIYESSFRHAEAISALNEATTLDPDHFWTLIDLGDIHWEVLRQREPALEAYDKAEALAKLNGLARDEGLVLDRKGSVLAKSDHATALDVYLRCLAIAKELADEDINNVRYQRYLAVSYCKVGDMLSSRDPATSLTFYQKSYDISKALANGDWSNKEYQRDLYVCFNNIRDMHSKSDPAKALQAYQDGFKIANTLAESDKTNIQYQRDLAVSHNKIGDVLAKSNPAAALKSYWDSYAIAYALADADRSNKLYQRDLSISYNKIGDVLVTSDLKASFDAYRFGHTIARALAEGDIGNKEYQRDLSISYDKIGNGLVVTDPPAALKAYQDGFAIRKALAEGDDANKEYQRDLAVSYAKIAGLGYNPRENWGKAHDILAALQTNGLLDPVDEWMVENSRAKRDAAE